MIEIAADTLGRLVAPGNLLFVLAGVAVGLGVGILPGLGGPVGMSLLLPFVFGLSPDRAIALLIGTTAVVHTADTFPAVLLGVPGSAGSQATIVDGYPMARRGEAGRALSAAFLASLAGGVIGAAALLAILPVARPLVLAFASPELFMLGVLGLAMVGVLAGRMPLRGILMAALGLLLGAVGAAPSTPFYRYTFDLLYLFDGLPLTVVALGLFALPEILELLLSGTSIATVPPARVGAGWAAGFRDVVREKLLVARSALVGVGVGFLPGLGGSVVDWISYGVAARTARDPEGFGRGDVRGVIAPEASNNAKEGGALIPTLLFGIPGSGTTAILLGGLVLLGVQPGPRMLDDNLDVTLLIVWTLALANVFGTLACLGASGLVARLATVPAARLTPFLLVIMTAAAYQSTRHWGDLVAFGALGMGAWMLRRLRFPLPPLLIGFVLSTSIERNLFISVTRYGAEWLWRPGVLAIGAAVVALTAGSVRLQRRAVTGPDAPGNRRQETAALATLAVLALAAAWAALGFPARARIYPLTISVAAVALALAALARARRPVTPTPPVEGGGGRGGGVDLTGAWPYLGWGAAYFAGVALVGMVPAAGAFVAAFLARRGGVRPAAAVAAGIGIVAALAALGAWLRLSWPPSAVDPLALLGLG